jgi:tRNA threonylcarbamoyladenosine biosynthesis protein TsaE
MKFLCENEDGMSMVADLLIEKIIQHNNSSSNKAVVVGLYGDLGSGKTTFTKKFADRIGIVDEITSPTFVVQRRYNIPNKIENFNFVNFYHFDMYRIEAEEELSPLGWQETISEKTNLIFVEWPEKIKSALPDKIIKLKFNFIDENTREVEISDGGFLEKCLIVRGVRFLLEKIKHVFKK